MEGVGTRCLLEACPGLRCAFFFGPRAFTRAFTLREKNTSITFSNTGALLLLLHFNACDTLSQNNEDRVEFRVGVSPRKV